MNNRLHRVVGIDLGTTYSAVAAYNSYSDSPEIILDPTRGTSHGAVTPSVVWLRADHRAVVGEEAKRAIASDPERTVIEIKREMGEQFTREVLRKYGAPDDELDKPVRVRLGGEWLLPQEISALILMRMKQIAERELGGEIHDAVITVPAYFTDPRRAATKEAALLAGLYPRQLIAEPTAAAICYGLDRDEAERKVYLVYDLGGGTFDVSIIVADPNGINVIATSGDPRLGGGDFDDEITQWVLARHGIDPSANSVLTRRVKASAEVAKRDLSFHETTEIVLPPLGEDRGLVAPVRLDQSTFESLIDARLRKSLTRVDDAINLAQESGITRDSIDAVLLVGGSTRIPLVKRMLLEHFGKTDEFVRSDVDPDTVVARGAAIVAKKFPPSRQFVMNAQPEATKDGLVLEDDVAIYLITEHTLGVGVQDNRVDPLIRRGTNIPFKVSKADYTNEAGATDIICYVYQGEGQYTFDNERIGFVEIKELDAQPKGYHRFEVTFSLDVNGLLDVRVKHLNTNREYAAEFVQNTRIGKTERLDARHSWLIDLYDHDGLGGTDLLAAEPPPITVPPPVTDAVPPDQPPANAGAKLTDIRGDIPADFRATVRRVQRHLDQEPDEVLVAALNAFAEAVNSKAPEDQLEKLGDELADVFDRARLNLR